MLLGDFYHLIAFVIALSSIFNSKSIVYLFLISTKVFTGNTDNTGIVYAWLTAPTRARFVRFRASDVSGDHICVRMEYYGSRDSQGIVG